MVPRIRPSLATMRDRRRYASYMEVVSVLEGQGEAWIDGQDGLLAIGPGITMVFPPNTKHGFRATGLVDLKTHGVHASAERILDRFPDEDR